MSVISTAKDVGCCICRYSRLTFAWVVKTTKSKFQSCKRCKAQRVMDERVQRLGTEIYSLYKQGETDFLKSLIMKQQFKLVEEAETNLFEIYDRIETIENDYREKKEKMTESCLCKKEEKQS